MASFISKVVNGTVFEDRRDRKALEAAGRGDAEAVKGYVAKGLSADGYNNVAVVATEQRKFDVLKILDAQQISAENRNKIATVLATTLQLEILLDLDRAGLAPEVHDAVTLATAESGRWTEAAALMSRGVSDATYNTLALTMLEQKEWRLLQPVRVERLTSQTCDEIVLAAARAGDAWVLQWAVGALNDKLSEDVRSEVAETRNHDWDVLKQLIGKGISNKAYSAVARTAAIRDNFDVLKQLDPARFTTTGNTFSIIAGAAADAGEWDYVRSLKPFLTAQITDSVAQTAAEKGEWSVAGEFVEKDGAETTRDLIVVKAIESDPVQWDAVRKCLDYGVSEAIYGYIAYNATTRKKWEILQTQDLSRFSADLGNKIAAAAAEDNQWDVVQDLIKAQIPLNDEIMVAAADQGQWGIVIAQGLSEHGLSPEIRDVVARTAANKGEWVMVKTMNQGGIKPETREELAGKAAAASQWPTALKLAEAGVSDGAYEGVALAAVKRSEWNVLRILDENRFSINARDTIAAQGAREGKLDIVRMFNKAGLSLEARSPLAADLSGKGEWDTVLELVQAGVDASTLNAAAEAAAASQKAEAAAVLGTALEAGVGEESLKKALRGAVISGSRDSLTRIVGALETRYPVRRDLRQAFNEAMAGVDINEANPEAVDFLKEYLRTPLENKVLEGVRALEQVLEDANLGATADQTRKTAEQIVDRVGKLADDFSKKTGGSAGDAAQQVLDQAKKEGRKIASAIIRRILK